MAIEDDEYDFSGLDFSYHGGEAAINPPPPQEDEYDFSGIDFSGYEVDRPDDEPSYFGKLTENFGTTLSESLKRTGSGAKLAAVEAVPDPDQPVEPTEVTGPLSAQSRFQEAATIVPRTIARKGVELFQELSGKDVGEMKEEAAASIMADIHTNEELIAAATPEDLTFVQESIRSGLDSLAKNLPTTVAGIATTFLTKNPSLGTAVSAGPMSAMAGIDARTDARLNGLDVELANAYGMRQGGLELAFEAVPDFLQNRLFKKAITEGGTKAKDFVKTFAVEMIGEQATTAYQDINTYLTGLDDQMGKGTLVEEIQLRAKRQAATAIATAVAAGSQQGGVALASEVLKAPERTSDTDLADEIMNAPDLETAMEIAELDLSTLALERPTEAPAGLPAPAPEPVTMVVDKSGNIVSTTKPIPEAEPTMFVDEAGVVKPDLRGEVTTIPRPDVVPPGKTPVPRPEAPPPSRLSQESGRKTEPKVPETKALPSPPEGKPVIYAEGPVAEAKKPILSKKKQVSPTVEAEAKLAGTEVPDVVVPEGFTDNRIKRDVYREQIQSMSDELVVGGDVGVVSDDAGKVIKRTPSINPDWFKNMDPEAKLPVVGAKVAVKKALAGKKLGVKQSKFITALMDNYQAERVSPMTGEVASKIQQRDEARAKRKTVKKKVYAKDLVGRKEAEAKARGVELDTSFDFPAFDPEAMEDITPKSGAYDNRQAAFRALEQKKKKKDLAPGFLEKLDRYEPVQSKLGQWVLRADVNRVKPKTVGKDGPPPVFFREKGDVVKYKGWTIETTDYLQPIERVPESKTVFIRGTDPSLESAKQAIDEEVGKTSALSSLAKAAGLKRETLTETPVDSENQQHRDAVKLIEGAMGKKVVFFKSSDSSFNPNGAILEGQPDVIYINAEATKPMHVVMGHELLHSMRMNDREAYDRVMAALEPLLDDYAPYTAWVNSANKKLGKKGLSDEQVKEEMVADMLGDSFDNPQFWSEVEAKSPTLYESILKSIQEYLNQFVKSLNENHLKGTGYFKDANKARIELAKLVKSAVNKAAKTETKMDQAANEAASSITNDTPLPSEAQIEAENYKKGHVDFQGIDVAIENPVGSLREGTDQAGKKWSTKMANHYGYIKRTTGNDGDSVDVFLGPNEKSDEVFIFNQINPTTKKFDEHKVMLGFDTEQQAIDAYQSNYAPGWKGRGTTARRTMDMFKLWLEIGDTTQPAGINVNLEGVNLGRAGAPFKTKAAAKAALKKYEQPDLWEVVPVIANNVKGFGIKEVEVITKNDPPQGYEYDIQERTGERAGIIEYTLYETGVDREAETTTSSAVLTSYDSGHGRATVFSINPDSPIRKVLGTQTRSFESLEAAQEFIKSTFDGEVTYSPDTSEETLTPTGKTDITTDEEISNETEQLKSRIRQWYADNNVDDGTVQSLDQEKWAKSSTYSTKPIGTDSFLNETTSQKEIKKQSNLLIKTAKKNGFFLTDDQIVKALDGSTELVGESLGAEHDVYFVGAAPNMLAIRSTSNGTYGPTKDTSPAQYLNRLEDVNQLFPNVRMQMLGVSQDSEGKAVIWTAQNFVAGTEFNSEIDLAVAMEKIGWVRDGGFEGTTDGIDYRYRHEATGAIIQDAHTGNVLLKDGELYPIDVMVEKMPDEAEVLFSPEDEDADILQELMGDFSFQSKFERQKESYRKQHLTPEAKARKKTEAIAARDRISSTLPPRDTVAGITDDRLNNNVREYDYPGNKFKGSAAWVDPIDFLFATSGDPTFIEDQTGELDVAKLAEEEQSPFLRIEDGEITGHEGRHRMLAMAKAGVKEASVVLRYLDATATIPPSNQTFDAQPQDPMFAEGLPVSVTNVVPLKAENKAEIKSIQEEKLSSAEDQILFSPQDEEVDPTIEFDEMSPYQANLEAFQRKIVDYMQAPRKTQRAIEKKLGRKVIEEQDFDQAFTQLPGSQRAEADDFKEQELDPLIDSIEDSGLNFEEASEFLHARHAQEANAHLKEINPGIESLSGMTDARARKIIDGFNTRYGDLTTDDIANFSKAKKEAYRKSKQLYNKAVRTPELNRQLEVIAKQGMTKEQAQSIIDQIQAVPAAKRTENLRNKLIVAKRLVEGNIKPNDALSGMESGKGSEAEAILEKYEGNAKVQKIGELNDQMNEERIDYLVDNNLISAEEAQAWRDNYDHYVPLQRADIEVEGLPNRGSKGLDVRGRPVRLRAGSEMEVDHENMIAHIAAQHISFIVKANKNKTVEKLYNLAKDNPDSDLWQADYLPPGQPTINAAGEVIRPETANDPSVISFKKDGENVYLWINPKNEQGALMIRAMTGMNKGADAKIIQNVARVNRVLSQLVTTWSPEFMVTNAAKDIQSAAYNLTDTELKDDIMEVVNPKNVKTALMGIRSSLRGDGTHPMSDRFEEFRKAGGMVGWMQSYDNIENHMDDIKKEVNGWTLGGKKVPGRKNVAKVFKFVSDHNAMVENAVRLSAFNVARNKGMSVGKAAKLAKELTVDFNRKGEWGTFFNSFYLFWNAGIQGSARLLRAATDPKNKKLRKMMWGTIAFSAAVEVYNRLISMPDEDEGDESAYDKIRNQLGSRYFVLMLGEDDYVSFPLPWGYNVLHLMGQAVAAPMTAAMGAYPSYDPVNDASRIVTGAMKAFNPMMEGTFIQSLSPTILDPYVRIVENTDWHGGPLYPDYSPTAPNFTKYYASSRETSQYVARKMHDTFVNPKTLEINSLVDWSPEWIDMGWDFATGGLGKFAADAGKLGSKLQSGQSIEPREIPFARKFYGEVGSSSIKQDYYDKVYEISNMGTELNRILREEGDDAFDAALEGVGTRYDLITAAKAARNTMKHYKQQIKFEREDGNEDEVKVLEEEMLKEMQDFTRYYNQTVYGDKNSND